ncbi:MAG: RDD family protein [Anaerolineae bacterium]|nr:RDD family protein [Anaerolineae bacterium]
MTYKMKNPGTVVLGDIGTRLVAIIIDGFILGLITAVLFGAGREVGGGLGLVIGVIYHWFFLTRMEGQTPGKRMMNLRVIKADGTPLSDVDAVIRAVGYHISAFFMLGYIWAFFDDKRRTWHDLLAGTIVVRA